MSKILFLDIETSPNRVFSWGLGKVYLRPENIIEERKIICISYKWAGEKKVTSINWGKNQNDKSLLQKISKVLLEADEIVAHNGDKFDLKWINGRLLYHNLSPLGPLTSSDTLKMSRKVFYLNSQKLNYLSQYMKLGKKAVTGGYSLWKNIVLNKCPKALKKMIKYCEQDVKLLEKVYNRIVKFSPNIKRKSKFPKVHAICINCKSANLIKYGTYTSKIGKKYQKFMCHDCGTGFKSEIQLDD